jgi:hypothetical protein
MIVVLVVTVDEAFLVTSVDSLEFVFVISNTFFGARSRGLRTVFVPVSKQFSIIKPSPFSIIKPSPSIFSTLSSELLLPELKDDTDFVCCVAPDDISDATNAALTSGANVFQDSKIVAGNKGEGKVDASSLFPQDRIELRSKQQEIQGFSDENV